MASFNNVTFIGNIGRDPELQVTPDGTPVTKFSLAVNERTGRGADAKESTMWLNIVAWRGLAETVEKYMHKGMSVCVSGRLKVREYTDREGVKRMSVDVVANEVIMLDRKPTTSGASAASTDTGDPFLPDFPD
jgi:single-strand DNA-binding protein